MLDNRSSQTVAPGHGPPSGLGEKGFSIPAIRKFVRRCGRDWENKKNSIIFTGLNNVGTAVWGKKK